MEWVETTAKTTAEAKESALDRLGVHEDDAEFEIVSEARMGLFGRVKEDARVRARVRPATPRAKDERRRRRGKNGGRGPRGQGRDGGDRNKGNAKKGGAKPNAGGREGGGRDGAEGAPRPDKGRSQQKRKGQGARSGSASSDDRSKKQENTVTDNEATMPLAEQADIAQEFVAGLAERFGASVGFVREDVADDEIRLTVTGDDLGRMVGPRGNTAAAIDELVRTVLQRQAGSSRDGRVRVDVGGVRARRSAALERFCRELAQEVRDSGVARALEPMNGADRKLTHDTIADEDGVATISEGEDPNRRVVIVPAGDA